jgi:hypothetical protein
MNQINPSDSNHISIGDDALQLVTKLPQINGSIKSLQFKTYAPAPVLEERLSVPEDASLQLIFEKTAHLKEATENVIPYWELIFAISWESEKSDVFIKEALKHDPKDEAIEKFNIHIDEAFNRTLERKILDLPETTALALCSLCIDENGLAKHLPMMDFRCKPSVNNLKKVKSSLKALGQKNGAILESGRSYHFYGFELMNRDEWVKYLSKCLLLAPIADTRYIAHRLIEGVGSLRLTASQSKPVKPFVVDLI